MTEPRSNGQAQIDVLLGVRAAFVEVLVTAPATLLPGLQLAIRVLDGTLEKLDCPLDQREV